MAEEEKTQEKEEGRFVVEEVATQTQPAIRDTVENKYFTAEGFLAMLGNEVHELKTLMEKMVK